MFNLSTLYEKPLYLFGLFLILRLYLNNSMLERIFETMQKTIKYYMFIIIKYLKSYVLLIIDKDKNMLRIIFFVDSYL